MKQLNSFLDTFVFTNLFTFFVTSLFLVLVQHGGANAAAGSYITQICRRIPIHTTADRTKGDNGFGIHVQGLPSPDKYKPGETYKVEVSGSGISQHLMGLMLVATATDTKGHTFMPGHFNTSIDPRVMDLVEDGTCDNHVISHRYLVNKPKIYFMWTAPKQGVGCVHFNASVIEHSNVWYKDDGNLHKIICEDQPTQQDSAATSETGNHIPSSSFGQEECCACGHAMYNVEFQGLWSRQTHPKGFPQDKYSFMLHWSSLVGATHSSDYQIWDYGQYASKAVGDICKFGASNSLENQMKQNADKIRTVVKTRWLWGPEGILNPLNAVFTVNKKKHLLSLLTMVGPSPDWCLGVSGESMCMPNCTWRDSMDIDLYPWDAGVDDAVTYVVDKKMPTEPQDIIRRISSSFPGDRNSPFYGQDIKPFAKLRIRKRKEACTDETGSSISAESSPDASELIKDMKEKMMEKKKFDMEKCATSPWNEWSDCSNPCGSGIRQRRRMLKTPGITASMCDKELQEKDYCVGDCQSTQQRKKLSDNFITRQEQERDRSDKCAVTGWSSWSPCSVTCGLGLKERWRMFLYKSEEQVDCGIRLMEKDLCKGAVTDCRKAIMMKDFTAICQQPLDKGPCRGNFTRWFYNHTRQKCEVFSYGGCRGNENRFVAETECVDLCAEHMADVLRSGHGGGSSAAMDKKMLMEKQMMMQKQRMMEKQAMEEKQKAMEEDMRRKEQLMERRRMEEKQRIMEQQAEMQRQKEEMERKKAMMLKQQMQDRLRQEELMAQKERMMRKHQNNNIHTSSTHGVNPGDQYNSDAAFAEKQKQKMMMKKKKAMLKEKRRRRRRRQRKMEMMKARESINPNLPSVDCMVTPWSGWSECSVTCGRGVITRTRMVKVNAENGGRPCPRRLVKRKKCRRKKCAVNCEMGDWASWSPCSETCGSGSVQTRRRPIIQKPRNGGLSCPSRREKRFCNVAMCPIPQVSPQNKMSSLSTDWASFEKNMEESMRRFMMFHRRY